MWGKFKVDTQDIPVLTEVYKTKPNKVAQVKDQVSPEILSSLVEELREKLKAELTSELSAALGSKLKQDLSEQAEVLVNQDEIANLRSELLAAIEHTNQTVSALENYLDQTALSTKALEEDLIRKNEALLETNKSELSETLDQLSTASTERINSEIAATLSEVQQTSISEAKSQIADNLNTIEDGFKQFVTSFLDETKSQLTQSLNESQQANKSAVDVLTKELNESIQASKTELSQLHQEFEDSLQVKRENISQLNQALAETQQGGKAELDAYLEASRNKFVTEINLHQQSFESAVSTLSEAIKNKLLSELEERQSSFDSSINTMVEELHAQMKQELEDNAKTQLSDFIQNSMEKKKQASVEELNRFYQEHTKQSQDNFAHRTQVLSQEMLDAVSAHSNKLLLETNEALAVAHQTQLEQARMNALAKMNDALTILIEEKRMGFKNLINDDLPAVEKVISERINHLLSSELPVFEEGLMIKVKTSIIEALQSIKLILPSDK